MVLDATADGALSTKGNSNLTIYGGQLYVDSTSTTGVTMTGNGQIVTPTAQLSASAYSHTGNSQLTGTINYNQTAVPDPLGTLAAPNCASMTVQSAGRLNITSKAATTLQPGVYSQGIFLSANANVTLAPGVYCIGGNGLYMSGNAVLQGNNVLIYNAGTVVTGSTDTDGGIHLAGNGSVILTPTTSGTYSGITIYQDRSKTAPFVISGNGSVKIRGTVYMKASSASLTGNATVPNAGSMIIFDTVSFNGNGAMTVNNY